MLRIFLISIILLASVCQANNNIYASNLQREYSSESALVSEDTSPDLTVRNEDPNNMVSIITDVSSTLERHWCNDIVSRTDVESISIETTEYGQVQSKLEKYQDVSTNVISICGPMDKSDFKALWTYISQKGLDTLDLTAATIENNAVPFRALYDPLQFEYGLWLAIKKIILPEGLTSIGSAAFAYTSLKEINIPSTVRHIGSTSFGNCRNLNCKITIPEGIEEIENFTFYECTAMTEAPILPQSLKRINSYAFYHTAFSNIDFPDGLECIKEGAFTLCGLTEVNIPDNCNEIEDMVFQGNYHLREFRLPDNIERISSRLLMSCFELEHIRIPSGCRVIGEEAFADCTSLKDIELNEGLETIGIGAFWGCDMESVCLPSSTIKLGDYCLASNSKLKTVYCMANTPPECAKDVFKSEDEGILYVPIGTAELYREREEWNVFKTIEETEKFPMSNVKYNNVSGDYKNEFLYDLTGRKVSHPLPNQTYIKEGRKIIHRQR